jgi:hypothetical protein
VYEHDRHVERLEVLLVRQVLVHGDEDVPCTMSPSEQLTVLKASPPELSNRPDLVACQLRG